ncbi:MAG: DoxX family membrane protein [Mesorhizobium sp.]
MTVAIAITFTTRLLLILLFLPFSAMDKVINFHGAVDQANEMAGSKMTAKVLILTGLFVEIVMSLGVLTGIADRLAAFVLAGYCMVTALLWKQFWATDDFTLVGPSKGRDVFWDFLKNFALAGGFLLITFGGRADEASAFLHAPFASTYPYAHDVALP